MAPAIVLQNEDEEALNRRAAGSVSLEPGLIHQDSDERFDADTAAQAKAVSLAAQITVAAQLAALTRAQASKQWLEEQPAEPAVVRVGPRIAVANLEDRIAWVDDALTDAQFGSNSAGWMQALETERARLVSSLAQVRYAETLAIRTP